METTTQAPHAPEVEPIEITLTGVAVREITNHCFLFRECSNSAATAIMIGCQSQLVCAQCLKVKLESGAWVLKLPPKANGKFSLIDLINHVGLKNVRIQPLMKTIQSIKTIGKKDKQFSRVTFDTLEITPNDLLGGPKRVGLILWVDRDKLPQ